MANQEQPLPATDELDLRAYLAVLARRWKGIVLVVVLSVSAALALSVQQQPQYRAESEILIRQSTSEAIVADVPMVNANEAARQLNNEARLFESGSMRAAVAERYDGPLDPDRVGASVSSNNSDVIRATVVDGDPEQAARLLDLYVETFVEWRRQQRVDELLAVGTEIQAKIDDLAIQVAEARRPLDELDAQLGESPGSAALQSQRDNLVADLASVLEPLERRQSFFADQLEDVELTADIVRTGGAQVLTAAAVPDVPISPRPVRDATLALGLGLVLGVGLAFLRDTLDDRIRGVTELEQVGSGLPTLALVPNVEKGHGPTFVATRDAALSPQAEAFRSLRTGVKFAALERPLKVLQVTSPSSGEGKTTAVANLAMALAQGGDRVAVVCCDLRRPRVQDRFDVGLTPGFTDVLVGDATLSDALRRYDTNVLVLPAGSPPPNPSELLSSGKASAVVRALSAEFDLVILDSTPVLPITDALVVSRVADATLVVADARSTTRRALRRTLQLLEQVNAPLLGLVLNGLPEGGGYGYGYGYSYGYGYGTPNEEDRPWFGRRRAEPDTEPAAARSSGRT